MKSSRGKIARARPSVPTRQPRLRVAPVEVKPLRAVNRMRCSRGTVLSMFSGCGGMDLGFRMAGFDVIWANDVDPDACATYERNLCKRGRRHLVVGDVSSLSPPSSLKDGVDVLIGGFPCQAFSNAGRRRGVNDARGLLYKHCMRFIAELRPRFTVFENVRGFLAIGGEQKLLVEEVCDELRGLGYEVQLGLVNAANYGVPQNRLRTVIVGSLLGRCAESFRFPTPVSGVDLTLGALLPVPEGVANQQDIVTLNPQAYQIGRHVPEGGSWKDIPDHALPARLKHIRANMRKYRWPNFYRRFGRDEIAGTITAAFKPENAGIWHPTERRPFSVREVARIQSFPDDFVFVGRTVKSMYAMIGNAVPPLMGKAFADAIALAMRGRSTNSPIGSYWSIKRSAGIIRPSLGSLRYDPSEAEVDLFQHAG